MIIVSVHWRGDLTVRCSSFTEEIRWFWPLLRCLSLIRWCRRCGRKNQEGGARVRGSAGGTEPGRDGNATWEGKQYRDAGEPDGLLALCTLDREASPSPPVTSPPPRPPLPPSPVRLDAKLNTSPYKIITSRSFSPPSLSCAAPFASLVSVSGRHRVLPPPRPKPRCAPDLLVAEASLEV